jgi:hypothetical protein
VFIRFKALKKKEFVANVVQVEMQRCHLYTTHHETITYQAKHMIIDNDMV